MPSATPSRFTLLLRSIKFLKNWDIQVREAFGVFPPESLELRLRNGWTIGGRRKTVDRYSFNEVWLEEAYNPPGFDWARCKTIVDVGGHIGCSALFFHYKAPHAHIISCEPAPENFALLKKNIEQNQLTQSITPLQIGVDEKTGESTFYIMKTTGGNSLFAYEEGGTSITIQTKTIGDVFKEHAITHCDFLKLDCEGAEYRILYTAPPSLLQSIDCIVLEFHRFTGEDKANPEDLAAYLQHAGFRTELVGKHMLFARRR